MKDRQKELKAAYKQTDTPLGVYQIRNLVNGKVFLGASFNLPAILNRHRFQLDFGKHPNMALQEDWGKWGADQFAFEVLDNLVPMEVANCDYQADLTVLEELWLEKIQPYGERGYNDRKKGK